MEDSGNASERQSKVKFSTKRAAAGGSKSSQSFGGSCYMSSIQSGQSSSSQARRAAPLAQDWTVGTVVDVVII